jgi:hypothetical protein
MGKEIQVIESTVVQKGAEELIKEGFSKGLSVESLKELVAMKERLEKEWARKEFFNALAGFQKDVPAINKTKPVKSKDGTIKYYYAPLDEIVKQVKDSLDKHGFSYTLKTRQDNGNMTATCEAHHVAGHTEPTEMTVPVGSDYMSLQQQVGAALTFAKRYAFCDAFGIMTGDEDTDAVDTGTEKTATQSAAKPETKPEDKSASKRGDAPEFPKEEHKPSAEFAMMLDRCRTMLNNLTADLPAEGKKLAFEDTCKAVFGVKKYYKPLDKFTLAELDKLYQRLNEDAAK